MLVLLRKLNSFLHWSWTERWLFAEAYIGLRLSRLAVQTLPFRWIAKRLGSPQQETSPEGLPAEKRIIVRQIAWAVRKASRYALWESNCLPQAITAKLMLRRREVVSTLYLGLARGQTQEDLDEMKAHAWLRSGKFFLVGGNGQDEYTVVATFAENEESMKNP